MVICQKFQTNQYTDFCILSCISWNCIHSSNRRTGSYHRLALKRYGFKRKVYLDAKHLLKLWCKISYPTPTQHFEGNHKVSSSKTNKNPKLMPTRLGEVVTGNLVSEAKVPKQYNFSMRCGHHGILEMLSQLRTKYYTCVENMYYSNTSLHLLIRKW
jgi:hypothetical protein